MSCEDIIMQGSTPTICIGVDVPLENISKLEIIFKQNGMIVLEKHLPEVQIEGNTIKILCTQEDTMRFSDKYDILIQVRIKFADNNVMLNCNPIQLKIGELFNYEVI